MELTRVIAVLVAGSAAVIDVRTRRIPNALTFGSALAALVYYSVQGGIAGLGLAVAGWIVGVALFLPMYLLRGMGAGDVKLLGAVGAWLGPFAVLWAAFLSVMAGGILALIVGAQRGYLGQAFRNLWSLVGFWRVAGLRPQPGLTVDDAPGPRLAYGVAIAVGTCAVVLLNK